MANRTALVIVDGKLRPLPVGDIPTDSAGNVVSGADPIKEEIAVITTPDIDTNGWVSIANPVKFNGTNYNINVKIYDPVQNVMSPYYREGIDYTIAEDGLGDRKLLVFDSEPTLAALPGAGSRPSGGINQNGTGDVLGGDIFIIYYYEET